MFSILIFGSPVCTLLIPCLSLLKREGTLDSNNIQKHGEQTVLQNYLHDEDKQVREETIFVLIFRWNIVLHNPYQVELENIEIKEWKQKVPDVCVKSCRKFCKVCWRHHISCILKKLYYMNLKFDYS